MEQVCYGHASNWGFLIELGTGELVWGLRKSETGRLGAEKFLLCRPGVDPNIANTNLALPS